MAAAGVSITARVEGDEVLGAAFARLLRLGRDPRALLDEVGGAMVASTEQRFVTEEDPEGNPWPALDPDYARRRRGGAAHILRRDLHLFDSLSHRVGTGEVAWGVNRVYARIHQFGGEAGRGGAAEIPARPYLGVSAEDRREIERIVLDHVDGAVGPGSAAR